MSKLVDKVAIVVAAGGKAVACVGSVTEADFGTRFVGTALQICGGGRP